jgi:hypothetical protein
MYIREPCLKSARATNKENISPNLLMQPKLKRAVTDGNLNPEDTQVSNFSATKVKQNCGGRGSMQAV